MDETDRPSADDLADDDVVTRNAAHEHAEHLRRRITAVARDIAASEDSLASVYEEAARLRPHAAERLQDAARQAREYAEKERRFSDDMPTDGSADAAPPTG